MADEGQSKTRTGLRRLAGLFVDTGASAEPEAAVELTDFEAVTPEPRSTGTVRLGATVKGMPTAPTSGAEAGGGVMAADFVTIWNQVGVQTDPSTDPLLTAFAEMASMPEDSRRIPMQAMIKGMRANTVGVSATLDARAKALSLTVQHQEGRIRKRAEERAVDVANLKKTSGVKVSELQAEIARLQKEVADRERAATEAGAAEAAELTGFKTRVLAETQRLGALHAFLATITATKG